MAPSSRWPSRSRDNGPSLHAYLDAEKPARFIARLNDHFGDTRVKDLTPEAIRQASRRIYPSATPATRNRQVIKPVQAAINHCAALGLCNRISIPRFAEVPRKKVPADLNWVRAFCDQAQLDGLPHLAALCVFMFGTAARVGEATALTWTDVDLPSGKAIIRMGKPTPWERTAHLPPEVVAALANIPSNRRPADEVFGYAGRGSVTKVWNATAARAAIAPLTPHCCRHGFATAMLHMGYDPKTVAERGGWKDATTVLRTYAHAMSDPTVTDRLFDPELTHGSGRGPVSSSQKKGIL